jgi:stress response protein YsnF
MDNMQEETFNKLYRHYYKKGVSYCKFEVLKKIYELSNTNLETLKEYAEMIGINENPVPEQEAPNPLTEPITTAELIRQLREGQE